MNYGLAHRQHITLHAALQTILALPKVVTQWLLVSISTAVPDAIANSSTSQRIVRELQGASADGMPCSQLNKRLNDAVIAMCHKALDAGVMSEMNPGMLLRLLPQVKRLENGNYAANPALLSDAFYGNTSQSMMQTELSKLLHFKLKWSNSQADRVACLIVDQCVEGMRELDAWRMQTTLAVDWTDRDTEVSTTTADGFVYFDCPPLGSESQSEMLDSQGKKLRMVESRYLQLTEAYPEDASEQKNTRILVMLLRYDTLLLAPETRGLQGTWHCNHAILSACKHSVIPALGSQVHFLMRCSKFSKPSSGLRASVSHRHSTTRCPNSVLCSGTATGALCSLTTIAPATSNKGTYCVYVVRMLYAQNGSTQHK